jgi:hypothetical protein
MLTRTCNGCVAYLISNCKCRLGYKTVKKGATSTESFPIEVCSKPKTNQQLCMELLNLKH